MIWLLWLSLTLLAPARAEPPPIEVVAPGDALRIEELIDDQIAAFRRDDARGAWRHVAPSLRATFGTPEAFLQMVQRGYPAVHRPRSYRFGQRLALPTGEVGQVLEGIGPDGAPFRALYLLERQPDGSWRTSGCLLLEPGPAEVAV